jgi:UDP-2-acetamido-3-amino-2,3-dideoxy-glucuronate N-acetyltransferase
LELLVACQKSMQGKGRIITLPMQSQYYIHPTATMDDDVTIGKDTKIWHYSHVSSGVVIGERCALGQNVYIAPNVKIGNNVRIQNNVSVYEGVTLEDDVFCGPSCVFTNDKYPSTEVNRSRWQKTLVRRSAVIGANATIICGITIGCAALVGAGAVVTKDVPDGATVYGNPAEVKRVRR